jgi:D-serine dehydratase
MAVSSGTRRFPLPVEQRLTGQLPFLWLNEHRVPLSQTRSPSSLGLSDVIEAARALDRFSGLLTQLFPELRCSRGIIESALCPADVLRQAFAATDVCPGRWLIKTDHALPVAGSVKARGGIYEVLLHAEELALGEGLVARDGERLALASSLARELFSTHRVIVGSTGNLGLSIGTIAAALGFRAVVHMSADAKEWKKSRLRLHGTEVIEHTGDYGSAVRAGREEARRDPKAYFVDDENSQRLFLGYSVAAIRLSQQLKAHGISVDARHPLFVYLPCGVGGAPGGITFGLRHLLGDHVHCFFAEPVASPCMLMRLATLDNAPVSVLDIGLQNDTQADGLAVGQASEFVARAVRPLVSGVFTVADENLFEDLYVLEQCTGMRVEPSAVAGFRGPYWLTDTDVGLEYLRAHALEDCLDDATHVLWTTGGAFVPDQEYRSFHEIGRKQRSLSRRDRR